MCYVHGSLSRRDLLHDRANLRGQLPIHYAVLSGNAGAVALLAKTVNGSVMVNRRERKTAATPLMLAVNFALQKSALK